MLEELAEAARASLAPAARDHTAWTDFFDTARGLIDVRAVGVRFAEGLCRWVRTAEHDGAPDRAASAGPRYVRCIPLSSTLDCGVGTGWEALAAELWENEVEINIAGPFPRWSADREAVRSSLGSWTLEEPPGATYPVTGLNWTGPTVDWGIVPLTVEHHPPVGNATVELRGGGRSCLRFSALDGLDFATRPLRHRALSAADAVGNHLREGLDSIDGLAQHMLPHQQQINIRLLAEAATRLAGRLVDIGALTANSALRRRLDEALTGPMDGIRAALPVRVDPPDSLVRSEDRLLRRVVPIATDVSVGGVNVVVRWMAVFTDLVVVVVTVRHGDPSGHDDGVNRVRWRLQDRWGWSRVLRPLNDWCGLPWTTFYLSARRPFWKGKRAAVVADAGGEEVLIPVEAGTGA